MTLFTSRPNNDTDLCRILRGNLCRISVFWCSISKKLQEFVSVDNGAAGYNPHQMSITQSCRDLYPSKGLGSRHTHLKKLLPMDGREWGRQWQGWKIFNYHKYFHIILIFAQYKCITYFLKYKFVFMWTHTVSRYVKLHNFLMRQFGVMYQSLKNKHSFWPMISLGKILQ